jgi:hypothetical protein
MGETLLAHAEILERAEVVDAVPVLSSSLESGAAGESSSTVSPSAAPVTRANGETI